MTNSFAKAYTEVLELLKFLPKEEYEKISREKIAFYENNKDKNYNFIFDETKSLEEQKISKEAYIIIVTLFRDFFATSVQKEKLEIILNLNEKKYQEELREKYNSDNIFKNETKYPKQISNEKVTKETAIVEYKKSIFERIKSWFKSIFNKNNNFS